MFAACTPDLYLGLYPARAGWLAPSWSSVEGIEPTYPSSSIAVRYRWLPVAGRVILLALLAVVSLLAAACTVGGGDDARRAPSSTSGDTLAPPPGSGQGEIPGGGGSLATPSPEVLARIADLPGRLAIGEGPSLAVANPDGSDVVWLDDGEPLVAGQPTWAPDGVQLAWSRTTGDRVEIVVAEGAGRPEGPGELAASELIANPAFYLQWRPDAAEVAFLRNDPSGLAGVELGLVDPGATAVRLGAASPLFLSWAPGSPMVAVHAGQRQVIVVPIRSGPADPSAVTEATMVVEQTGQFTAPAWIDDDTLLVATTDALATVTVSTGTVTPLLDTGGGPVRFVLSPDRRRVAFTLSGALETSVSPVGLGLGPVPVPVQDAGEGGPLQVIEIDSGDTTTVADTPPAAFEWSPDSSRLAWLEPGLPAAPDRFRWQFWDGTESTPSAVFIPSDAMQQRYLPFFEQYAQSVTGWSPDGTAFAFAGRPDGSEALPGGTRDGIWVQLVDEPGTPPVRVALGDVVVWSPRNP